MLRKIFELDGSTVSEAANGLDAVNAIMKTNPEFVILDDQMPVQEGEETARTGLLTTARGFAGL